MQPLVVSSTQLLQAPAPTKLTTRLCVPPAASFHEAAQNCVVARLLCCLVNEQLAEGHVVELCMLPPILKSAAAAGRHAASWYWLCVSNPVDGTGISWAHATRHVQFWAPLRHMPLPLQQDSATEDIVAMTCKACPTSRVGLLDPEDLGFPTYELTMPGGNLVSVSGARQIMEQLGRWHSDLAEKATVEQVIQEMENSALHQEAAYIRRQAQDHPLLQLATASAIEWEQSIVEGHATHPMHKSRFAVPHTLPIAPDKDLHCPTIYFFAVSRSLMTIRGPFDELISPLLQGCKDPIDWPKETVVPVHELQLPNIRAMFPWARQLSLTQPVRAQVSLRTVLVEALPHLNLKLPIGMKVSSCMRTVSPWSTHIGPSFTPIAERVIEDRALLELCNELASVVAAHPNPDYAKHFSCIIRQDAQLLAEPRGEHVVVCAALTEKASQEGEFVVNSILRLQTQDQRSRFFRHYARRFLEAFTTPLYKYGISFEAHQQNVLARFRRKRCGDSAEDDGCTEWELVGFTVRDLGGIKVHQPRLRKATGLQVDVWNEEASVLAEELEEVHDVAFHTMMQCHLHRMARAMGMHEDGSGWEAVRSELHRLLPLDCLTRRLWLHKPTARCKAFLRMKLQGLYRDYVYTQVPNLILCRPFDPSQDRSQVY